VSNEPPKTNRIAPYLNEIFNVLIQRLGVAVPDLGKNIAGDSTGLSARRKSADAAREEIKDGPPQASGGRKEYKDDDGKVTKVVEWFGFKLHLIIDFKHEIVLLYKITDTKAGDGETLPEVLESSHFSDTQSLTASETPPLTYITP
jgi:hypothetical protein